MRIGRPRSRPLAPNWCALGSADTTPEFCACACETWPLVSCLSSHKGFAFSKHSLQQCRCVGHELCVCLPPAVARSCATASWQLTRTCRGLVHSHSYSNTHPGPAGEGTDMGRGLLVAAAGTAAGVARRWRPGGTDAHVRERRRVIRSWPELATGRPSVLLPRPHTRPSADLSRPHMRPTAASSLARASRSITALLHCPPAPPRLDGDCLCDASCLRTRACMRRGHVAYQRGAYRPVPMPWLYMENI